MGIGVLRVAGEVDTGAEELPHCGPRQQGVEAVEGACDGLHAFNSLGSMEEPSDIHTGFEEHALRAQCMAHRVAAPLGALLVHAVLNALNACHRGGRPLARDVSSSVEPWLRRLREKHLQHCGVLFRAWVEVGEGGNWCAGSAWSAPPLEQVAGREAKGLLSLPASATKKCQPSAHDEIVGICFADIGAARGRLRGVNEPAECVVLKQRLHLVPITTTGPDSVGHGTTVPGAIEKVELRLRVSNLHQFVQGAPAAWEDTIPHAVAHDSHRVRRQTLAARVNIDHDSGNLVTPGP
mmetsp:Transcript_146331/g.467510  ORF Transcript_146331/g.467510 Transcript_146331/m.467510 type:complete len:294 (+) Transcript_146331:372-1253(+)